MMLKEVDNAIRRSQQWSEEMAALRPILLEAGLTEEFKWYKPCYTHRGKNILIVQEMKDFLAVMFFKGALLSDPEGVLKDQGPNSRSARRLEFTSVADVTRLADTIHAYVDEAIDVEESGAVLPPAPDLVLVAELQDRLDEDPDLAEAFAALTPGRQREYNIYVSGAKQAKTRVARVDRYIGKILAGKGMRE